jgi:hypothetical protein
MPYDPPWGGWIIAEIGRNVVAGMRGRNSGRTSRILIRRGHRGAMVQFAIISRFNEAGLGQGGAGDLHRQAVRGGVHPRPTSVTIMQVTAARGWTVGSLIYPSRQIPPSAWSCKRAWARSFARCESLLRFAFRTPRGHGRRSGKRRRSSRRTVIRRRLSGKPVARPVEHRLGAGLGRPAVADVRHQQDAHLAAGAA